MLKKLVLFVVAFILSAPFIVLAQQPKDKLVIAISQDFQPFTFLNIEGKPAGMFVDMWRLWAQKTGRQIEFISSNWSTSLDNLKNMKADIHSGLLYSPERFKWMSGSQPFYEAGVGLFYTLKQGKISDMKELSRQTVAVLAGGHQEEYLKKNYPDIRILGCDTREELVKVSMEGKARGFIAILPVGTQVIDRMGVSGELETHDKMLYREKFHIGVLKENTELLALVDKGFNDISRKELATIEARWIPDPAKRYYKASNIIALTPTEEGWLKSHKSIKVGMSPVYPPLKFSENGVIKGIEPDYLSLLSEYTGIKFEYVIADFPLMDAKVKSGEMDMFLSYNIPERLSYMMFTDPFMEFKQVIVARSDAPFISGIAALKGKKMATVKGVKLFDKILAPYPEIEAVPVNTMEEMFKAVSESKADALISRTYIVGYVMQDYPNLKITGVADLPPEPSLYAVRKDYPELVGILNKGIKSIPKERFDAIIQKWSKIRVEYRTNWHEITKWAAIIGGAFFLILGLTLFWNRRLAREVDIRKQSEEALREQTAIAQTFMDALPCVALLLKPRTREIVALNKAAGDAGAQLGSTCFGSWLKTENACHYCRAPELWEFGKEQTIEIESIGMYWEAHWVPVSQDLYLHYALDITERKRMEEEKRSLQERVQRSEKMESLGTLAGGVAHDLNNVLGIIVGYSEMVRDGLDKSNPLYHHIETIMNGGLKAAAIVEDMLTLARRGVPGRSIVNLNKIVAECQKSPEFMNLLSYHPDVKINPDLEQDLLNISGSSVHLGKTLYNLVSNASEAMPKGGTVTITTTNQYLDKPIQGYDPIRGGDYVVLSVSDTGEGISENDLKRIFEPFYTKKIMGRSGTGLGLAVVWGTVKDHNGYINVQSEEGKGSTFTLYFPVTRADITAEHVAASISEYQGKGEFILVVDDVKEQRDLAAGMLRILNYNVSIVPSGEEALVYMKEHEVDLMVLDMIMDPGMDGLDTYKKILEIRPNQKAIIVSGFSESDRVKTAKDLGVGVYVRKPYIKEKLGMAVRKELDRK
jgi:ABC-type amino acid transport substrate-binding protein/signal transduction histidine kinase/ActR/RegA family two-component response regulator